MRMLFVIGCCAVGAAIGLMLAVRPYKLEMLRNKLALGRFPLRKLEYSRGFLLYIRLWGCGLALMSLFAAFGAGGRMAGWWR
jgi:hypothetical protein